MYIIQDQSNDLLGSGNLLNNPLYTIANLLITTTNPINVNNANNPNVATNVALGLNYVNNANNTSQNFFIISITLLTMSIITFFISLFYFRVNYKQKILFKLLKRQMSNYTNDDDDHNIHTNDQELSSLKNNNDISLMAEPLSAMLSSRHRHISITAPAYSKRPAYSMISQVNISENNNSSRSGRVIDKLEEYDDNSISLPNRVSNHHQGNFNSSNFNSNPNSDNIITPRDDLIIDPGVALDNNKTNNADVGISSDNTTTTTTNNNKVVHTDTTSSNNNNNPNNSNVGNSNPNPNNTTNKSKNKIVNNKDNEPHHKPISHGVIEYRRGKIIDNGIDEGKIGTHLGAGLVYLAMNSNNNGALLAVKQFILSPLVFDINIFVNNLQQLLLLTHANLLNVYAISVPNPNKVDGIASILMEYIAGQSLNILLNSYGSFTEDVIANFSLQILFALKYLAEYLNREHGFLSTTCILMTSDGSVKVGGLEKLLLFNSKHDTNANHPYCDISIRDALTFAPEKAAIAHAHNNQTLSQQELFKADIWSLGCIILEMATGEPPFDPDLCKTEQDALALLNTIYRAHNDANNGQNIKYKGTIVYPPQFNADTSPILIDFIMQCLTINSNQRISIDELLDHEFLDTAWDYWEAVRLNEQKNLLNDDQIVDQIVDVGVDVDEQQQPVQQPVQQQQNKQQQQQQQQDDSDEEDMDQSIQIPVKDFPDIFKK